MMKYNFEIYLDSLVGFEQQIKELSQDKYFLILKTLRLSYPSIKCSEYIEKIIITDFNKKCYKFNAEFLIFLSQIHKDNNEKCNKKINN